MSADVAVVIVNFNAGEHLGRCLRSVRSHAGLPVETVVVDNASRDSSLDGLDEAAIQLIRNDENRGFGAAINQGARATSAPLLLVLNPDCELSAGALPRLAQEIARWPGCGLVGPCVTNADGSYQGSARADPSMLAGFFGRSTVLSRAFPALAVRTGNVIPPSAVPPEAGSLEVDWVSGACMLVSREAFDRCGGFDERYFLFWEDADLCRRARNAGFSVRFCPAATVVHAVGVSRRTAEVASIVAFHASAERYYHRHVAMSRYSIRRWLAVLLLRARCRWLVAAARRRVRPSKTPGGSPRDLAPGDRH